MQISSIPIAACCWLDATEVHVSSVDWHPRRVARHVLEPQVVNSRRFFLCTQTMRSIACMLLLAAAAVATAQLAAPISSASLSAAAAAAGAALQTGVSPADAVAAATVLNKAGKQASSVQCSTIHGLISSVSKPGDAGRIAVASKLAGCTLPGTASGTLGPLVTEALTGPCLPAVAFGVQAAPLLGVSLDSSAAAAHVLSFAGKGGLFAPAATPSKPTAAYTAAGWKALASLVPKLSKGAELKRIKSLAKSAGGVLSAVQVTSDAAAAGHIAAAAVRLSTSLKLGTSALSAKVVSDSADALALHVKSPSLPAVAGALTGLKQLGTKKAAAVSSGAPVALTLSSQQISADSPKVSVQVQSVFGDSVPADVTLVKAVTADKKGKPSTVAKDVTLGASGSLDATVASWAPGRYMLTLQVAPKGDDYATGTAKRVLVISTGVQWNEAVVLVSKTSTSGSASDSILGQQRAVVTHPKSAPKAFTAGPSQYIHVLFSGKAGSEALSVRQAMVHLTHVATGATAVFKPVAAEAGTEGFKVTIDVGNRNTLGDAVLEGEYSLSLIAGGAGIAGSAWKVATLQMTPAAAVAGPAPPLYTKHLLHDSNVALGPLPELEHQFRMPEARPSSVVSLFFAGLVAAPLVILVGYYASQAGNTVWRKNVPFLSAAVFHIALGAALLLFASYFFDMVNMFECLILLAIIAVPMMLGGSSLLRTLRSVDETEAGK